MSSLTSFAPRHSARLLRTGLIALLGATPLVSSQAQTREQLQTEPSKGYNAEVRRGSWSIFAEGGTSWATEVWYPTLNQRRSYELAPAVGGGIDYTIRPWIRVGGEYLWSRYRREQRVSSLDAKTMPIKVYGNYLMNFHNAKLGLGLNFMELWPRRGAQWLNLWLGTGLGYTMASGNEYAYLLNNTLTQGGKTIPLVSGISVSNESSVVFSGGVRTTNRAESFETLYVPATLHLEADVSRQFSLGLKGELDWLLDRKRIAPRSLVFALATVRYNFVRSAACALRSRYEGELSTLNDKLNALQRKLRDAEARAEEEAARRAQAEARQAELEAQAQGGAELPALAPHFVQFDHDSYTIGRIELERLRAFARSARGHQLELLAEASTPGSEAYNQQLSSRRLQQVAQALIAEGFAAEDLDPQIAIGEEKGKPAAEGRRVTITIKVKK